MNHIGIIRDSDLYEGAVDADPTGFRLRTAGRAVVFDKLNQVALLKVGSHNYYKLPGGGVEEGEDLKEALRRELLEEIGCEADVFGEVGQITQYLNEKELKQISYCYLAKQTGEKGAPDFTDEERANGCEIVWAKDINAAITFLEESRADDYSGTSIVRRDLTLLITAKAIMEKSVSL
jgi:8-oxo-dGTP diphosphatase